MRNPAFHLASCAIVIVISLAGTAPGQRQSATENASADSREAGDRETSMALRRRQARNFEKGNALPLTAFYDTPENFSKARPGDLLRVESCEDYRFPFAVPLAPPRTGIKIVRFLYCSKSVDGQAVPASGVILLPYGRPPEGGWPVIAWAHGTSGVGRHAAPSLMKDLYYSWSGLLQWPMLGYAVVAPDYAGLGTEGNHQYIAVPAQAQDVVYAVPSAREAVKDLGRRWLAIGRSQGGCAVLGVAELQGEIKSRHYLGAIALAPGGDLEPIAEHVHGNDSRGLIAFLAYGMKSVYEDFHYRDFLTPRAADLMATVEEGGIMVSMLKFAEGVPAGEMLRADWKENPHFQAIRKLSILGEKPVHGPVLLLHGEDDEVIPIATADSLYRRMVEQQSAVEYRKYPGIDHDTVVFASFRDQVAWVRERFGQESGD